MASPQKENGFTAIANEVLDKLILFPFPDKTGVPIRLIMFVIRKTWGYQKKVDVISLTQFEKGITSNRPSVVHWLQYLVKANILVKGKELTRIGIEYSFNKDWEQWKWGVKATQLVKARKFTSMLPLTKSSNVALTHKRKKENTKETTEPSSEVSEFINLFKEINPTYQYIFSRVNQRDASKRLLKLRTQIEWQKVLSFIGSRRSDKFCPRISTPIQLEQKYASLETYAQGLKETTKSRLIL